MKKKFSTAWKASKQPRKQRKYAANAPIHLRKKTLSVNLNKELRKKYSTRNVIVKKGDLVKVMRGKFKGKQGKVLSVKIMTGKILIENVQKKKMDGSNSSVPMKASNLQIQELNMDNKRRIGKSSLEKPAVKKDIKEQKKVVKETTKKEETTKKTMENTQKGTSKK